MATKDPQWIVSNREDGTNVNAWHWVEHDCLPFLQQHAEELFCGQSFGGAEGKPKVTVKGAADAGARVTGEATANNRRQKTIYIYELEVVLKCDAVLPDGAAHSVTVTFPYVGEDTEPDDWEVRVACTTSGAAARAKDSVALAVRPVAAKELRSRLAELLDLMREHYRCHVPGTGSDSKTGSGSSNSSTANGNSTLPPGVSSTATIQAVAQAVKQCGEAHDTAKETADRAAAGTATLELDERFATSAGELFELLLDSNRMSMVTGGAKIERRVGGAFTLFSGAVTGFTTELVPGERLVQRWRFASWRTGAFSTVTLALTERNGETRLHLTQVGVPEDDRERTLVGWRENIFARIRGIFGFGGIPAGF